MRSSHSASNFLREYRVVVMVAAASVFGLVGLLSVLVKRNSTTALPRHSMAFGRSVHKAFPEMAGDIVATATYFDAKVTFAERLGLELLLDGMEANPGSLALALNSTAMAVLAGADP